MKQFADGVWHIQCLPVIPWGVNAYLLGDVLVDAGARQSTGRILGALERHEVSAHALTHAHPDHQGASHAVCERFGVPFWVGEADVEFAERPELIAESQPSHPVTRLIVKTMTGPGHPVDRPLREGDEVGGFTVLDTPGHSPGHVAFWREADRTLVLGDVLNNMDVLTAIPGLREPKRYFTPDPAENRRSARRLGELEPELVLFGHGAPLRDRAKFAEFCANLPA